jgi:O-antigen ligase
MAIFIFLVVSSYFDDRMLLRMCRVISISGLFFLALGFYSFIFGDVDFYTSSNIFLTADKNKYGAAIGRFLPFFIMFSIQSRPKWKKLLWAFAAIWAVLATILSASRGAMGNVFAVMLVFALVFFKRRYLKVASIAAIILLISTVLFFNFLPKSTKLAFSSIPDHLLTFNLRTHRFWEPAMEAVKKKPLFGWGYGKMVYRNPKPFENGKQPAWEKKGGLHNAFISILFHQGIFGLVAYLCLLCSTVFLLIKILKNESSERRLLAVALLSIIIGSFFVNSFVKTVPFRDLAIVLVMSAALFENKPERNNY